MVQWFKHRAFTTEGLGLVTGCQTKILQAEDRSPSGQPKRRLQSHPKLGLGPKTAGSHWQMGVQQSRQGFHPLSRGLQEL